MSVSNLKPLSITIWKLKLMFDYKKPPSEFDSRDFFLLHIVWLATVPNHGTKTLGPEIESLRGFNKKKHANMSLQECMYVFM